jgi:N-succinyldiaminopimelate aminotransferase
MNPNLQSLQPYPFAKLQQLFADLTPAPQKTRIALSIGEPQHASPAFVLKTLSKNLHRLGNYPTTAGLPELRHAISTWLQHRYALSEVDSDTQVLPVNCTAESDYLPDFSRVTEQQWQQCQLLYLCSPGNPTGAVMSTEQLQNIIRLAREFNFIVASDECYSEIYVDEASPPPGLLQACATMGDNDFRNCVVFHSLSKRSNLPGLRSGFVAGDAEVLRAFGQYRTYHGCAMPIHHQLGSIAAWNDEQHVIANRQLYRDKFSAILHIFENKLPCSAPEAGFYLWPETPISDLELARKLYVEENVVVLPGRFLARESEGVNPGENRLRMALVASQAQCEEAAQRIVHCVSRL